MARRRNNGRAPPRSKSRFVRQPNQNMHRDAIIDSIVNHAHHPPSIVDSDECSSGSFSSATLDYLANLHDNTSSTDEPLPYVIDLTANESAPSIIDLTGDDSPSSSSIMFPPSPTPPTPNQHPVLTECLIAYQKFSVPHRDTELVHLCHSNASPRFRLALHRAAQLLGAVSQSTGEGSDRQVIMKMNPTSTLQLSEVGFKSSVLKILANLYGPPEKEKKKSYRESYRKRRRMKERKMQRRIGKMDSFLKDNSQPTTSRRSRASNKKPATFDTAQQPVGKGNIGYGLLQRMGWSEGQPLGSKGEGLREPLVSDNRRHRAGIGS